MDISPMEYLQRMKRYWRRRRYQKIQNASKIKRKLMIDRLGSKKQRILKEKKKAQKMGSMFLSPLKLMEKFHTAYVDAMLRLAGEKKGIERKRFLKGRSNPVLMSGYRDEVVDSRMVMEIYNRLVSKRDQSASVLLL